MGKFFMTSVEGGKVQKDWGALGCLLIGLAVFVHCDGLIGRDSSLTTIEF
jgi:hypothetical protein